MVLATVLDWLLNTLSGLSSPLIYTVVGLLVFAEAGLLVGFFFPGETAVFVGGILAYRATQGAGSVNLAVLMVVVVVCAISGDSLGYFLGERFGTRLLALPALAKRRGLVDWTIDLLRRRGALAVFVGRFTAFLRVLTPGLAGMSGLHYRRFLFANAAGGLCWGVLFSLLGYWAGNAYERVAKYASWAGYALVVVVIALAVGANLLARRREREIVATYDATHHDADSAEGDAAGGRR